MTDKKYVVIFLVCLIIVWTALAATYLYGKWLDFPYMTADDPDNPGNYGGLVITNEVKYIAKGIVDEDDTPHEKVLKDMKWTHDNLEFKSPPARMAHPDVIIESGIGLCGDYAIVVTSLLACQGVQSRIVGMYNQTKGAHVVIEAYYDDDWHMYGPTHQSYWETNDVVLSFYELRTGNYRDATLNYIPNHIPEDYYLDQDIYIYSEPAGAIGPEYPMWWPLTIDREYIVPPIGYYAAGSRHIGATYTNNCHNWTITNLTPGGDYSFIIYPKEIRGTDVFEFYVNETMCEYSTSGGTPIYINFTADSEIELLHIGHNYRGIPEDVLMLVERYEVISV